MMAIRRKARTALMYFCLWPTLLYSAEFAGGGGSSGDPYQIMTADYLRSVNEHAEAHFVLMGDIDLSDHIATGALIPVFSGSFDGAGHHILNLAIHGTSWWGAHRRVRRYRHRGWSLGR